jgi:OOP family OmpA-OmpF porin
MRRAIAAVVTACLLAGCQTASVTLLPNEDGKGTGAVAVLDPKTGKERGQITQADYEARSSKFLDRGVKPRKSKRGGFLGLFGGIPPQPFERTLQFETGTTIVTEESRKDLAELLDLWKHGKDVSEIQIIGYTDTVGSLEDNDALSLLRAQAVRDMLANEGFTFTDENSRVTGRGERELLVATPDETDEPMNRRVVVVIR